VFGPRSDLREDRVSAGIVRGGPERGADSATRFVAHNDYGLAGSNVEALGYRDTRRFAQVICRHGYSSGLVASAAYAWPSRSSIFVTRRHECTV